MAWSSILGYELVRPGGAAETVPEPATGSWLQEVLWRAHEIAEREGCEVVEVYELRRKGRVYRGIVSADGRLRRWRAAPAPAKTP